MLDALKLKLRGKKSLVASSFLVFGILIVIFSYILSSCGSGPQSKTFIVDAGPYAVDFNQAPQTVGYISTGKVIENIAGSEFTVEAWIKKATSTLTGVILHRSFLGTPRDGFTLYIRNNYPRLQTRNSTTGDATWWCSNTGAIAYQVTSTAATIATYDWYHIAGVFSSGNDSHGTTTPHIDIYVNGALQNSAGAVLITQNCTGSGYVYTTWIGRQILGTIGESVTGTTRFMGTIDEVRFWTVARTPSQIGQCYNQQLGISGGDCGVTAGGLVGYWKLNEGTGNVITDVSGNTNTGTKYYCQPPSNCQTETAPADAWADTVLWGYGWVAGYPF